MHNKINKYLICICVLVIFSNRDIISQSLMGYAGLVRIPTATNIKDKKLSIGAYFIDKSIAVIGETNNLRNIIALNFLPFLEVDVVLNNLINSNSPEQAIGDRQTSFKIVLQENNYLPNVGLGFYDLIGALDKGGIHSDFYYFVLTKDFEINKLIFSTNVGYAGYVYHKNNSGLNGIFYGLSATLFNSIELMGEYDSRYYNIGTRLILFNHLSFLFSLIDMKHFSGGASFSFQL